MPQLSKRLRYEVLRRDDHTCRYCGAKAPDVKLTVDHVLPVALGGSNDATNLVTACGDCNAGKSSSNPDGRVVDDVAADALRWADAITQAANELAARRNAFNDDLDAWYQAWTAWTYPGPGDQRATVPLPADWRSSVRSLMESGARVDDLVELVQVAMTSKARDAFRYFCGCGWNHVRALQDRARQLLTNPDGDPVLHPASSFDEEVRNAYWSGHIAGFNEGYEDGWEMGLAAGRSQQFERPKNENPLALSDILHPPKDK
jgi:hypothetical protein